MGCYNTIIPTDVVAIGELSFFGMKNLTEIVIPSSVTTIGSEAFWACSGLVNITLSAQLISIGASAFKNCNALESITIPSQVTSIGAHAFSGAKKLLSDNGGSGITFEDTSTWERSVNEFFTVSVAEVDVTSASQNAIWLVGTEHYYNYYWRKV